MEYKFHIFTKWYDLNDNDYASDIDDMQEIFINTGKYINYYLHILISESFKHFLRIISPIHGTNESLPNMYRGS